MGNAAAGGGGAGDFFRGAALEARSGRLLGDDFRFMIVVVGTVRARQSQGFVAASAMGSEDMFSESRYPLCAVTEAAQAGG